MTEVLSPQELSEAALHDAEQAHWAARAQYIYRSHHDGKAGRHLLTGMMDRILCLGKCEDPARDPLILEVGCAAGTQTIALQRRGYRHAWGLDINVDVLRMARDNAGGLSHGKGFLVAGDAHDLPFAEGSFDLVFSVGVMEHLPDLQRALVAQRQLLRPGGRIVMAVPNSLCPWWTTGKKWRAKLSKRPEFAFPGMFRTFSPAEGMAALEQAGFTQVDAEIADAVMPQTPDWLAGTMILAEKLVARLPGLRRTQAMLYAYGTRPE